MFDNFLENLLKFPKYGKINKCEFIDGPMVEPPEVGEFFKNVGRNQMETSNFSKFFINYAKIFDFQKPLLNRV